eukprot:331868-Pleurochrysis_carterae.AAC.1
MSFEAMNQVFKRFATTGNYIDVCGWCAKFWCLKAAQASCSKSISHWSETEVVSAGSICTYDRSSSTKTSIVAAHFTLTSEFSLRVQSITAFMHQARNIHAGMWALLALR